MWIGTQLGGVHTYAGGRLSRAFGPADGVATSIVASFAQDRDGRVWIGSNANGLSVAMERSLYMNAGGVTWASGTNASGTPLPSGIVP